MTDDLRDACVGCEFARFDVCHAVDLRALRYLGGAEESCGARRSKSANRRSPVGVALDRLEAMGARPKVPDSAREDEDVLWTTQPTRGTRRNEAPALESKELAVSVLDRVLDKTPTVRRCKARSVAVACSRFPVRSDVADDMAQRRKAVIALAHEIRSGSPSEEAQRSRHFKYLSRAKDDQDFSKRLRSAAKRERMFAKMHLPGWTFAEFREGGGKKAEDVVQLHGIALDFDDGVTIDNALDRLPPVPRWAYTTFSHTVDAPRFRVVVPFNEPVDAADWPEVWGIFANILGDGIDESCKDPQRFYASPAVASEDAPRRFTIRNPRAPLWSPRASVRERKARRVTRGPSATSPAVTSMVADTILADDRRRTGERLGGRLRGSGSRERVDELPCPACGRKTLWYWVSPSTRDGSTVRCKHQGGSCGYTAPFSSINK